MAYATVDELAAALRIRVLAENTVTLQACVDAAAGEINHEIDWDFAALAETFPAASWRFSTATASADPGSGYLRRNKSSANATTALYIDGLDSDGGDVTTGLLTITTDGLVRLADEVIADEWEQYIVIGPAVDRGGWVEIPVDLDSTGAGFAPANGEVVIVAAVEPNRMATQKLALANRVNVLRGVEWWKANDAAFGVIGFDQTGALQAPRDGFNRHAYTLTPLKQQWGIA